MRACAVRGESVTNAGRPLEECVLMFRLARQWRTMWTPRLPLHERYHSGCLHLVAAGSSVCGHLRYTRTRGPNRSIRLRGSTRHLLLRGVPHVIPLLRGITRHLILRGITRRGLLRGRIRRVRERFFHATGITTGRVSRQRMLTRLARLTGSLWFTRGTNNI